MDEVVAVTGGAMVGVDGLASVDLGLVARVICPGARHKAQKRSGEEPLTAFH
jgi:predicted dinucleotide-utilizing enzyme